MEQDPDYMDFMGHAPFALKNRENREKTGINNSVKRTTNQSLYNQLHNKQEIIQHNPMNDKKAIQYKMDYYQETESNRIEKPSYQLYEIDEYENMDPSEKYLTNVISKSRGVVCPTISLNNGNF